MLLGRPSTLCAIPGVARKVCAGISSKEFPRTIRHRQYASAVDTTREKAKASSSLLWIVSAGLITGGGTYYLALEPRSSTSHHNETPSKGEKSHGKNEQAKQDRNTKPSSKDEEPAVIPSHPGAAEVEKTRRKAEYEDDHPKPVEERHGDSVNKHSIAAEKNQHKLRIGKFSKEEFDNHLQKHTDDPCKDFEKVEGKKEGNKVQEDRKKGGVPKS
ncbi:hypothetical protein K505DRAFT_377666 [Melanomma pulvis-pyrius CBS 109.77]|uniref:Uncharacterized protein n=1 Tax=Melanomma pulvis-pyrius CBS 109.77 TaxID=1314802 RepID=A0A6A6X1Z0_9PLEO|nr:hypothetical protein K505DRAFT_377666 [Melanomma pulvis-pyrius CBS 109.77]